MMRLPGIHDREGRHIVPTGGWCLDTIALAENPKPTNYTHLRGDIHWLVRVNWGYGSAGTLPLPEQYSEMARRLTRYVESSPGCSRWIIGNEPNLPREWPQGRPIRPIDYAECYVACRHAIHAIPGHTQDEVLVAGPGPWNAQLTYPGNLQGDWVAYFEDVQELLGTDCDGFALHAYARGYSPEAVTSEARMDAPFVHRRKGFRVYRDWVDAIQPQLRHKPRYLTEVNGNGPWEAQGLIPAVLEEISAYNATNAYGFRSVVFYRYPAYDQNIPYHMEGKADILAEFQAAAQREYILPKDVATQATAYPEQLYMPQINSGVSQASTSPTRDIDPRLVERGMEIVDAVAQPGQTRWQVVRARWYNEAEAEGRHHIYVEALDTDGKPLAGIPFTVTWPSDKTGSATNGRSGFDAGNVQMSPSRHEFSVAISDGQPSDRVQRLGMGAETPSGFNAGIHTSTLVVFQRMAAVVKQPQETSEESPTPTPQPSTSPVPTLVHPVGDARYRIVTQPYGVNGDYYQQFTIDGVPLLGHEGIDFGTPAGTRIVAVAAGRVTEVGDQSPKGYGKWVKVVHAWGESVYAHLSQQSVRVGDSVQSGQLLGLSGSTGNSSGPHLHFGLRVNPYNRSDGWGGYIDPAPYLNATTTPVLVAPATSYAELLTITKAAAAEFKVDWRLLSSLILAESSYNPQSLNPESGARGLGNLMAKTWAEWAAKLGTSDIFDPTDNARVTAAYLAWCIKTAGNERKGLWAYNWGIGRVLEGKTPPDETLAYATKVLFGRDLLMVVGA